MRPSDQYAEDDEKQPDLPGDESKQPEKGHDLAHMTAPSKDQRLQALRPGNGQRNGKCANHGQELGRGSHLALDRERAQEQGHLRRAHLHRMPLAMEDDVATDPRDVGVLGAATVVASAQGSANTVEQTRPSEVGSDRKSTRLNSSHSQISYAVFCL